MSANDDTTTIAPTTIAAPASDLASRIVANFNDARPVLEIDGIEGLYDTPAPVATRPTGRAVGTSALEALNAAGLNFPVGLVQPQFAIPPRDWLNSPKFRYNGWVQPPNMKDFQACMRLDTGHIFGMVSPGYGFVQPEELAATVDAALPEGTHEVKVKGSAFGDFVWFECSLPNGTFDISPEVQAEANGKRWIHLDPRDPQGNMPVKAKLLVKHSQGGKGGLELAMLLEVTICGNGLCIPLLDGKKQLNLRHSAKFAERVSQLRKAFSVAGGFTNALADMLSAMPGTKITVAQFDKYCKSLFPGETTQAANKRAHFETLYNEAVGAAPGTAWGALQAATYFATHEAPVRVGGRSLSRYTLDDPSNVTPAQLEGYQGQARLEMLVNGQGATFTEKAYQHVVQYMLD